MSDETLVGDDIAKAAANEQLLEPFDASLVRGASYDIRAGRTIVIAYPEPEGGITPIDLQVKGAWSIPPGHTAILYSLERVRMPANMKGRLSLRARLATKLLLFTGGLIDPGYEGYLFLPIANLSESPIEIRYGEPVVTAEFVRLRQSARPYSVEALDSIPEDRKPAVPPLRLRDLSELTHIASSHDDRLLELRKLLDRQTPLIQANTRMVDTITGALVTGIGAGAALATVMGLFTQLPEPWNWVGGGGAIIIALLGGFILRRTFLPGQAKA